MQVQSQIRKNMAHFRFILPFILYCVKHGNGYITRINGYINRLKP